MLDSSRCGRSGLRNLREAENMRVEEEEEEEEEEGEVQEEEGGGDQGSSLSLRERTRCSNAQIHRPKARRPWSQPHLMVFIISEWPKAAIFGKHYFRGALSWINP